MISRTVALCLCLSCTTPAVAQMTASPQPDCGNFHRNQDGSWSPTRTFSTNGVTLDPSWHFYPGYVYGSTNVVGTLNQYCAGR
jgi:hypothetical protein